MNERVGSVCTAKKDASLYSEFGHTDVNVYQIKEDDKVIFNTNGGFLPQFASKEYLTSPGFTEIELYLSSTASMRTAAKIINRVLHLPEPVALSSRTLANKAEREGQRLTAAIGNESASVLTGHDF